MYQQSLVILKPDAVQRRLVGRVIQRFEDAGLKLHGFRLMNVTCERSRAHYVEHVDRDFYPSLEGYITSGPVLVMVLGGTGAIAKIRLMTGDTRPSDAAPGTIRGDFAHQFVDHSPGKPRDEPLRNLIHASANADDAKKEVALWFDAGELVDYPLPDDYLHGI